MVNDSLADDLYTCYVTEYNVSLLCHILSCLFQRLSLLPRVRILAGVETILTEEFQDFPQALQENSRD